MNRKITARAFGAKCGRRGASGFVYVPAPEAAARPSKKPSAESRPVRARPVKPAPVSQRNSRRVRPQNWRVIAKAPVILPGLIHRFALVGRARTDESNQRLTPGR